MVDLRKILSMSRPSKEGCKLIISLVMIVIFLSSGPATAKTSTYVFVTGESTVVQTGGFLGIHETYPIEGQFQLSVDLDAGTASFDRVDANLTEPSTFLYTQSLGILFNMTELLGTVVDDTTIEFEGETADNTDTDIIISLTFTEDSVHLIGETIPPSGSADFFEYDLDAIAHKKYGGGTGEPNNPYLVYTAEQMNTIGAEPNDWNKHFKLMADIDLSEYTGTDYNIVGYYREDDKRPFTGVFDGNGHKISNFSYTSTGIDNIGLFGYANGFMGRVIIKDLNLIDPNIYTVNGKCVGSLVGQLFDGTITDCYVKGVSISGGDYTGGLVGACSQTSMMTRRKIINCYCTSTVSGNSSVGGLVGSYDGTMANCHFAGNVAGNESVGGLIGDSFYSEISNCHSTGMVLGIHQVGGLVGSIMGYGEVFRSTSSGRVLGEKEVGGLVGLNIYGEISNCYSTGSASGITKVAGLVGVNQGTVGNCYSAGSVGGITDVGGLVGSLNAQSFYPDGTVSNSFWDIETSGQTTSAGGVGKTTDEMQMESTFTDVGWDFVEIWGIGENQTYPYLRVYPAGDLNHDGLVDFLDLADLANNWLAGVDN